MCHRHFRQQNRLTTEIAEANKCDNDNTVECCTSSYLLHIGFALVVSQLMTRSWYSSEVLFCIARITRANDSPVCCRFSTLVAVLYWIQYKPNRSEEGKGATENVTRLSYTSRRWKSRRAVSVSRRFPCLHHAPTHLFPLCCFAVPPSRPHPGPALVPRITERSLIADRSDPENRFLPIETKSARREQVRDETSWRDISSPGTMACEFFKVSWYSFFFSHLWHMGFSAFYAELGLVVSSNTISIIAVYGEILVLRGWRRDLWKFVARFRVFSLKKRGKEGEKKKKCWRREHCAKEGSC